MWQQIGVSDDAQLSACAQLFNDANGTADAIDAATLRSAIARGLGRLFLYTAGGAKVVIYLQHSGKQDRHVLCTAFAGATPSAALDLLVTQIKQFAQQHQLAAVFGIRPASMPASPLQQMYDLAFQDPRLQVTTVATTTDSQVWKIEAATP